MTRRVSAAPTKPDVAGDLQPGDRIRIADETVTIAGRRPVGYGLHEDHVYQRIRFTLDDGSSRILCSYQPIERG